MKNLLSGLIGALLGAFMGYFGLYATVTLDISKELKQAQVDLIYSSRVINENLEQSAMDIPMYNIIQNNADWPTVFVDISNKDIEQIYYDMKQMDDMREYIILRKTFDEFEDTNENGIDDFTDEYYDKLKILSDSGKVEQFSEYLIRRIDSAYDVASY